MKFREWNRVIHARRSQGNGLVSQNALFAHEEEGLAKDFLDDLRKVLHL